MNNISKIAEKISLDVKQENDFYIKNIDSVITLFFDNESDKLIYQKFTETGEKYDIVGFLNLKLYNRTLSKNMKFVMKNDKIYFCVNNDEINVNDYVNATIKYKWRS